MKDKRLVQDDQKRQAYKKIFQFYSVQHDKKAVGVGQQYEEPQLEKGELNIFCKDFGIKVAVSRQLDIFRSISTSKQYLNLNEFMECMPLLGYEMAKGKARENKYRLKEIKAVLEYPAAPVNETLQKLLDNCPI